MFRAYSQGPLGGVTLTPDLLRDVLAEARLSAQHVPEEGYGEGALPSPSASLSPSPGPSLTVIQTFGQPSQPEAEHLHNLPVTLTSFVGREHELDEVSACCARRGW